MKATVIGVMRSHIDQHNVEIKNENMPEILEDLKRLAGAEGGICYMSKPYFDSYVSEPTKAYNRFNTVAATGHHSIAGHSQVAMILEGIPKILAMYLNNLTDYETSEKSGRYTVMTGNTESEIAVYEKWCSKLQELIYKQYGDKVDERTRDKLAKENARYFLSIFTPTTMGYTTSLRQWNYIYDWAKRFSMDDSLPQNYFFNNLKVVLNDFAEEIKPLIYVEELRDFKNRVGFDMIDYNGKGETKFQFGKMYNIGYWGTFAEYAQLQRHRTLFYTIQFNGQAVDFYVPDIVATFGCEKEWLDDMNSVAEYIPTGTMIYIEESGNIKKFYLKSMERNCGRAQLEIMRQNLATSKLFYEHLDEFPQREQNFMKKFYFSDGTPKMKGQMLACKEPCAFGCNESKTKII